MNIDPWFIQLAAALFCGFFFSIGIPLIVLARAVRNNGGRF